MSEIHMPQTAACGLFTTKPWRSFLAEPAYG